MTAVQPAPRLEAEPEAPAPVLSLQGAALGYGDRMLWSGLDLDLAPGSFLAVLGANGSGKTSLLRAILGLQPLAAGQMLVAGRAPTRGSRALGYVPQQRRMEPTTPLRARDVVRQGLDGHRFGVAGFGRVPWDRIEDALAQVGAAEYADVPVGVLSGGEQQRVRIAQALVTDPQLLLCDEPLLSLDLTSQRLVTSLVDRRRREHDTAVVFVTHEINPVLPYVDQVLYLAGGRARLGSVDEVMTSSSLSELYGSPVEVLRSHGRIFVAGTPEHSEHDGVCGPAATSGPEGGRR